ncbi:MAG: hypothetical protein IPK59_07225 [Rhodospirillaceae bacterium]|nr:hypothetical protein [Rhodospirillaceae bacterium]
MRTARRITLTMAMVVAVAPAMAQDDILMLGNAGGMSGFEFDNARMSFFNEADRDGDFALSPDEIGQAMAHGGSRLFEGTDLDGDGVISIDEYLEHGIQLFSSLDADGDGVLGEDEM